MSGTHKYTAGASGKEECILKHSWSIHHGFFENASVAFGSAASLIIKHGEEA